MLRLPLIHAVSILTVTVGFALAQTGPTTRQAPTALPADQMLDRMLKPSGPAAQPLLPSPEGNTPDRSTGANAVAPHAPQLNVMREGTYVVDRTGRLSHGADGQQQEFTFESDGKTMQDPPIMMLPNLKLMAMEKALELSNRDLRFRVTGMVTEYHGRNYLLLDKVVVVPDAP